MIINVSKLDYELRSANIPIDGCNSNGQIVFKAEATKKQKDLALSILTKHTPDWYIDQRRLAYKPISDQLEMMYQDKINGTNTWIEHIKYVKTKFPKQ